MALSAPLLSRKKVIKVKTETTKGNAITADEAILVYDLEINPNAPFERRAGSTLYLGNSNIGVLSELTGTCTFKAELRGEGTSANVATPLASLLKACGYVLNTATYSGPNSTVSTQETVTITVWEDGIKKTLSGCAGNVTIEGEAGGRVMLNFEMSGNWVAPTDDAMPAYAPNTLAPMVFRAGTFTIATNAIKISKFSFTLGCNVIPRRSVAAATGVAHYQITDVDPILTMDPEADLVAGYDYHGAWLAGTEAAVALVVGGGTGLHTFTFAFAKTQYRELKEGDRDGIAIYDITAQCNNTTGTAVTMLCAAPA